MCTNLLFHSKFAVGDRGNTLFLKWEVKSSRNFCVKVFRYFPDVASYDPSINICSLCTCNLNSQQGKIACSRARSPIYKELRKSDLLFFIF